MCRVYMSSWFGLIPNSRTEDEKVTTVWVFQGKGCNVYFRKLMGRAKPDKLGISLIKAQAVCGNTP